MLHSVFPLGPLSTPSRRMTVQKLFIGFHLSSQPFNTEIVLPFPRWRHSCAHSPCQQSLSQKAEGEELCYMKFKMGHCT